MRRFLVATEKLGDRRLFYIVYNFFKKRGLPEDLERFARLYNEYFVASNES